MFIEKKSLNLSSQVIVMYLVWLKTRDDNQGFIKLEMKQTCLTTTGDTVRSAVATPNWTSSFNTIPQTHFQYV